MLAEPADGGGHRPTGVSLRSGVRVLVGARALRGFADGFASILLAHHLSDLGFSAAAIGAIVTATLVGSAALTLWVGLWLGHVQLRRLLLLACLLMAFTGVGFATLTQFWPLIAIGFVGTLNPSGGDVSMFLPVEQTALTERTTELQRPSTFAIYNLAGALAAAAGALASALPSRIADAGRWDRILVQRLGFLLYVVIAVASMLLYRRLPARESRVRARGRGLVQSKRVVYRLSALFALDSAGGGLAINALLVLYLERRFDLSPRVTATTFFVAGVLGAFSQLVAARLVGRIGLVNTMVFTHLPANAFLALAGIVPSAAVAVTCLLLRASMASMDIPARQALVMKVVAPEERAAAASVTNVPRSLATATTPALAGFLLDKSTFGWPLVIAGASKALYDVLLLRTKLE